MQDFTRSTTFSEGFCKKENGVGGNLESRRARASADDS